MPENSQPDGTRLRLARQARGLSQQQLAGVAGVTRQAVSAVESKYRAEFLRDALAGRAGPPVKAIEHASSLGWDIDRPLVVVKARNGEVPESGVTRLDDAARVRELARMLGGMADSDSARAHAEELLANARTDESEERLTRR